MAQLLCKVHPSLRAVQIAFHRKSAVAHEENQVHQKRWAFLMDLILRASVFIMIAGDHDKNRRGNPRPAHLIWRGIKIPADY